jgi:hypothetical protein
LEVFNQTERNVTQKISFVKFVEKNHANVREIWIILQPPQENAFRNEADFRAEARAIFEANLITDFGAEFDAAFPRDTRGNRARSDAARLKNDDHLIACQSCVPNHLRSLRRFTGTGRGDKDEARAARERFDNLRVYLPDG